MKRWKEPYALKMLVGGSLLLLLGFLIYWNVENYQREKEEFIQDLNDQMSLAASEYRDSVVKRIFRMVRVDGKLEVHHWGDDVDRASDHDSIGKILKFQDQDNGNYTLTTETIEALPNGLERIIKEERVLTNDEDTVINIRLNYLSDNDSLVAWHSSNDSSVNLDFARNLSRDTTVIWGLQSEAGQKSQIRMNPSDIALPSLYNQIDSLFTLRLERNNIFLRHEKVKSKTEMIPEDRVIYIPYKYETLGITSPPVAIFKNYQSYILKSIAPALLLSTLLFSWIAISFYLILKSWADQLRLTILKNEFVSNMTHELNTPISTIGVAIEAFENFGAMDDPEKRTAYLDITKNEVSRLKMLVDKVLNLSALDQEYNKLSIGNIDFKKLVEDTLKQLKLYFEKNNLELTTDIVDGDYNIQGDKVHLRNVLHNLIDNAIKYSNGIPRIHLKLEKRNANIYCRITDQGMGIPRAYQNRIFDRFFRVPTNDIHNVKGYGLGLHYVQSVVQQHGGKIKVNSKENEGTTIILEIPVQHG